MENKEINIGIIHKALGSENGHFKRAVLQGSCVGRSELFRIIERRKNNRATKEELEPLYRYVMWLDHD